MLRSATRAAALAIAGIAGLIGVAAAQTVMIAPATGQTPQQQAADQHACETDAAARTGYRPSQPPPAAPTPPATGQGWPANIETVCPSSVSSRVRWRL